MATLRYSRRLDSFASPFALASLREAKFENGLRVHSQATIDDDAEWDFSGITTKAEATVACIWEYAREVEWIYDFRAELLDHPDFEKFLAMPNLGKAIQDFFYVRAGLLPCYEFMKLFLWGIFGRTPWPQPWILGSMPKAKWRPDDAEWNTPPPITWAIQTIDPNDKSIPSLEFRDHTIRIDWSQPERRLMKAFRLWLNANKPDDLVHIEWRGKRAGDPFSMLKWLAAYRLTQAKKNSKKTRQAEQKNTKIRYPSFGKSSKSNAAKKARNILVKTFLKKE